MVAAVHRARQFLQALRPSEDERLVGTAIATLSEAEARLFLQQGRRDRKHAVDCWLIVQRDDESVRRAALLHDAAKGDVRVFDRVLYVILSAVAPRLLHRLASEGGARWRRALGGLLHHAERSAEAAERAGADAETVRLIRLHHSPVADADPSLRALIDADNRT